MKYRQAAASDVAAIAGLHADSWQRHYRGAYLDSYLDGDVLADRMTESAARLSGPQAGLHTVVADLDGEVTGFAHVIFDADPAWGAYLDARHGRHDLKRRGIGGRLIAEAARAVARRSPATGLYLWVLEQNAAARAFYAAHGGRRAGRELSGPFPGRAPDYEVGPQGRTRQIDNMRDRRCARAPGGPRPGSCSTSRKMPPNCTSAHC
jgi:GNAT superfamily N-acetyltransferase